MAFLMAASATLEAAKKSGGSEKASEDSVEMASRMLKHYKQAAQALNDRHQNLGSAPSKTENKSQVYMLIMVKAHSATKRSTYLPCSGQCTCRKRGLNVCYCFHHTLI